MPQGAIAAYLLVTPPGRCRHLTVRLLARQSASSPGHLFVTRHTQAHA